MPELSDVQAKGLEKLSSQTRSAAGSACSSLLAAQGDHNVVRIHDREDETVEQPALHRTSPVQAHAIQSAA